VDFEFSSDQHILATAADELLTKMNSLGRAREVAVADRKIDEVLWAAVCEQGWPLIAVPEESGGIGLGFVELAVLAEAAGKHAAPVPVVSTALAAQALVAAGDVERLAVLTEGGIGTVAWTSVPAVDAPLADIAVQLTADSVAVLDLRTERPEALPSVDPVRSLGRIAGRPDATEIGGREQAQALLDRAAVLFSASMLGAAQAVVTLAAEYAKVREQFGRPIGSFQAVKHRCADMYVDLEGMRAATYYAAWSLDNNTTDASQAASTAKAWCSEAGPRVMANGLQVHGGIGFTWDHDLHLFLKRTEVDARQFGDDAYHRERLISRLRAVAG
jgi:alkylation response protein AidB-like acyl-CoA dehydrogenase